MQRTISILLFCIFCSLYSESQPLYRGEYFFDTDPGNGAGTPFNFSSNDSVDLNLNFPITGLTTGFHQLYIRFQDVNETWGMPDGRVFYIYPPNPSQSAVLKSGEYFYDTDPGNGNGIPISFSQNDSIDIDLSFPFSNLSTGFHLIHVRFRDINGKWGLPESRAFYVYSISSVQSGKIKYAEYFIDTDPGNGNGRNIPITAEADSVDLAINLSLAGIQPGSHQLFIRFADVDHKWGIPEPRSFFIDIYTFIGNGNWTTPINWTNSLVPPNIITASDEVLINPAPGGQCTYSGNIAVLNGGKLSVQTGKILNITGDFNNDGALQGTGTVNFQGAGVAMLSSSGTVSTTLRLTNKTMKLNGDTKSANISLLSGSTITLDSFRLDVGTNTISGANGTNFIITNGTGMLQRNVGNSAVTFPVGINSSSYNPVTITNNGAADSFSVRVVTGVLTRTSADPFITGAVDRTWVIKESVQGGSNLNLIMQWNAADEQPGFRRDQCFIAKTCPPPTGCVKSYEDLTGSVSSGTNPYTITRTNLTNTKQNDSLIVRTNPVQNTFTGNGSWSNPANWSMGVVPGLPIKAGDEVIINPPSGTCTFTGDIYIEPGGILRVSDNKSLIVTGKIILLQ